MTVTYASTAILSGTSGTETIGAPAIEGAAANSYTNTSAVGRAFNCSVAYTGRKGCKITLAASVDVSAKRYLGFGLLTNTYNHAAVLSSVATGGLRIIVVDSSGNYVGFNVYGSGIPNYAAGTSGQTEGFFTDYATDVDTTVSPNLWMIDRSAAPDISSGTMDWTQVASIELNANNSSSSTMYVGVGHLLGVDAPVMTGTETFASIVTALRAVTAAVRHANVIRRTPYIEHSASGVVYNSFIGLTVGNGVTATNLTDSDFSFAFINTYDKSPTYRSTGPRVLLDSSGTREFKINQSASDVLALSDGSFASAAYWQWVLSGSGTATLDRINFIRFNGFTAAHGVYTDCVWDGGEAAVAITASTGIVRGTVRNGVGHGIKITGAAGDYSDLDIAFDNNSTYDIELGAGGAGTYNLAGISVIGAYTLKIRNDHASNAVVVQIPAGITSSTSTAGGTISVEAPSPTLDAVVLANTRAVLWNRTTAAELDNTWLTGTSWSKAITSGASSGDVLDLYAFREGYLESMATIIYSGTDATFALEQAVDPAIDYYRTTESITDYTTLSEFNFYAPDIYIQSDDADGATSLKRLFIYYNGALTTEDGARYMRGGITFRSAFDVVINRSVVPVAVDNVSATLGLYFTDEATIRVTTDDGTSWIAPPSAPGSIRYAFGVAPGQIETGVSGLTGPESAQLMALPSANATANATITAAVDGTTTLAESIRLHNAILAGKVSGAGTGTETFRDLADTKDRVVVSTDVDGNRLAVTKDVT